MRPLTLSLLFAGTLSHAAGPALSDRPFASALQDVRRLALERKAAELLPASEAAQLSKWLGWYGAMQRRPKASTAEVAAEIGARLRAGGYGALVLGESHGVDAEIAAAGLFLEQAFAAGPVGAFLHEKNTWEDMTPFSSRGIPVMPYANQFKPAPDVEKAHKLARRKLLVSYSGAAHSSDRSKDYSLWTLEDYRTWGYKPGQTDMPTIEQALAERGRKPVIVSMMMEQWVWRRIQFLFLKRLAEPRPTLAQLRASLAGVIDAWRAQVQALPETPGPISFVREPGHDALWLGLTPHDRRPVPLLAAALVLAEPETSVYVGERPIRLVESLWSRMWDPVGGVAERYTVVVHLVDGGKLEKTVEAARIE